MASTYLILISVLLTASQTQGQCPLSSCNLVSQVNICINESATMSGGCSDSQCVMALRESTTVDECCNKIEQSMTNAPTSGQNGGVCGEAGVQTQFGDTLNFVNSASLHSEINEGTYIMPQTDPEFIYSCNGCIKSIQLAVSPNSLLKDAQLQERIKFHTFTDKTGDRSIYQRREDVAMWNYSSVVNIILDRKVVDYRPIGSTEVCFSQGDVFGFTIEAGSDITVLARFPADANRFVLNASSTSETISGCPQLSDSSLYTTTGSFFVTPLIHIVTGGFPPTEPPMTITEPSTTEPTTQATTVKATPDSATTPSNPNSTPSTGTVSPPGSGYIIYAAAGVGGAVCILLIVVIIVSVVACTIRPRSHNRYTQNGEIHNLSNFIDGNAAYGVSNLYKDCGHMDSNEAHGISNPIGIGDHNELEQLGNQAK